MTHAIRLSQVSRRFDATRTVIADISFEISSGEQVALLGESGTGKSTLLNLIAGLDVPDRGTVEIAGQVVSAMNEEARTRFRRDTLGFVFQAWHLIPHLSALQNVMLPLILQGRREAMAAKTAKQLMDDLGLSAVSASFPATLSGGEQQRLAIARALIHKPAVVLADEPTGSLDPATAAQTLDLLLTACATRAATLLMVTHSADCATRAGRRLRLDARGVHAA